MERSCGGGDERKKIKSKGDKREKTKRVEGVDAWGSTV